MQENSAPHFHTAATAMKFPASVESAAIKAVLVTKAFHVMTSEIRAMTALHEIAPRVRVHSMPMVAVGPAPKKNRVAAVAVKILPVPRHAVPNHGRSCAIPVYIRLARVKKRIVPDIGAGLRRKRRAEYEQHCLLHFFFLTYGFGRFFGSHFIAFLSATESAIATACFTGLPSFMADFILCLIASREQPLTTFINPSFGFTQVCIPRFANSSGTLS